MCRNLLILPLIFSLLSLTALPLYSQSPQIDNVFMQGNNINTVFRTDGVFNYDKVTFTSGVAGFVWPVSSSTRKNAIYATGIWLAAEVGAAHELRNCCSLYNSFFSPGNIPLLGQVPPSSVCEDTSWRGYHVNLTDPDLVNGGTRTKTAGGHQYTLSYDSWAIWPVSKGAPYVEVNGIPGYQPGWNADRPGIGNSTSRPDELCFMVFMDYKNCTNNIHMNEIGLPGGTLPMGAEIHQIAYMFNCYPLQDAYFIKWEIINKSNLQWNNTYFAIPNDVDLGYPQDDSFGCDTLRDLQYCYNGTNNDQYYGANPPSIGTVLLQGPLVFTGNPIDTVRLPGKILVGYLMKHANSMIDIPHTADPCWGFPDNASEAYRRMKGINNCYEPIINPLTGQPTPYRYSGNSCSRNGWFDSLASEILVLQSTGPFTMNPGDTQTIVMVFVIGSGSNNFQNVCNVQTLSDSARKYYYNDFPVCFPIGVEQTSTEVPDRFILYQNYPNPFNPSTKIKFSVPSARDAYMRPLRLVVYDVLGREVAILLDQTMKAGTYEVDFDGTNLPSGMYFYVLITEQFTQTNKMVLIK